MQRYLQRYIHALYILEAANYEKPAENEGRKGRAIDHERVMLYIHIDHRRLVVYSVSDLFCLARAELSENAYPATDIDA